MSVTTGLLLLAAALSFLPGYGLLVHIRRLSPAERLACSGALSAAVCGAAALACFLLGQATRSTPPMWPVVAAPLVLGGIACAFAPRRGNRLQLDDAARQIALVWLLLLGELLAIEVVVPTFGGAGWSADWWVHFHRALVYANLVSVQDVARSCVDPHRHCMAPVYDNGVITARTPLYNVLCGMLLGIDGGRMAAYQIGAAVWGALLAPPVVLLAQRRGLRAGGLAGGLLLLNPSLLHLAAYPWPAAMTAGLEVLGIYWLCRMRDGAAWAGAGVSAALLLATFTHTAALVYVCAAGTYLCWRGPLRPVHVRALTTGMLAIGGLVLPWVAWGVRTYGWRGVLLSSPTTRGGQPGPPLWLVQKIEGMIYSLVPMPLAHDLAGAPLANIWITINDALQFPFDTYTGAQGVIACLLLLRWAGRATLSRDMWRLGLLVAGWAAACSVVLDPAFLVGGAEVNAMSGATALGIVFLATLEPVQRHRRVVSALIGAEAALVFGAYLAYLSVGSWRLNPNVSILAGMDQHLLSADLGTGGRAITLLLLLLVTLGGVRFLQRTPLSQSPAAVGEVRAAPDLSAAVAWTMLPHRHDKLDERRSNHGR